MLASLQEFAIIVTVADFTNASYGLSEWAAVPFVTSINAHISKGCGNRGLGMELRFPWQFLQVLGLIISVSAQPV